MKPFNYRMSSCEIIEYQPGFFKLWHFQGKQLPRLVAAFPARRAAINYLAKEFVIPIRHGTREER